VDAYDQGEAARLEIYFLSSLQRFAVRPRCRKLLESNPAKRLHGINDVCPL
jgi:hypothetical protein